MTHLFIFTPLSGHNRLSKAFHAIQRFSEDIDIILDWRVLGFEVMEPWIERSNTKQDAFNKNANARTAKFLQEKFLPAIRQQLTDELGQKINVSIDETMTKRYFLPTLIFSSTRQFCERFE